MLVVWEQANAYYARMAELADALDSKSSIARCAGSNPALGTNAGSKLSGESGSHDSRNLQPICPCDGIGRRATFRV